MLFKSFATIATIVLGAVSALAAPSAQPEAAALVKKQTPASLPQIFASATAQLTPLTNQLQSLTPSQLTVDDLTPITSGITTILTGVISSVENLAGETLDVILAPVEGTVQVTVTELATIISELVHLVLDALQVVLNLLLSAGGFNTAFAAIQALLSDVGQLVGTLVSTVLTVVGGLVVGLETALTSLLSDLLGTIFSLGLSVLGGLLGILGLLGL